MNKTEHSNLLTHLITQKIKLQTYVNGNCDHLRQKFRWYSSHPVTLQRLRLLADSTQLQPKHAPRQAIILQGCTVCCVSQVKIDSHCTISKILNSLRKVLHNIHSVTVCLQPANMSKKNFRPSEAYQVAKQHNIMDKCWLVVTASRILVFLLAAVGVTILNGSSNDGPSNNTSSSCLKEVVCLTQS
jgi:hypothetical protein